MHTPPVTCSHRSTDHPCHLLLPLLSIILAITTATTARAASITPTTAAPASPGVWLLDLAWNQAGRLTAAPAKVDAVELVNLLQAATRMDPQLAEAWRLQYDLFKGLNQTDRATDALARYVDLTPDDEPAMMTLAAEQIAAGQTAQDRLAICRRWLELKDLPDAVMGFLLRTKAQIHQNRLEDDQALKAAQHAVAVFPYEIASQRLLLDLQPTGTTLSDDLNLNLWTLRANPADVAMLLDVGRIADALGLYPDAMPWYTQAKALMTHFRQDTTHLTLQLADHWLAAGDPDQAVKLLAPLAANPDAPPELHLLLAETYTTLDKPQQALKAATKALRTPASQPAATASAPAEVHAAALTVAQTFCLNSWVRMNYLNLDAIDLDAAKSAFEAASQAPWARRCYGWALLKAGQTDLAVTILEPIASTDAWANLGLAQAAHTKGNPAAAAKALAQVQDLSPSGPARRAAARWAASVDLAMPAPEPAIQKRAKTLLAGFDNDILDLPLAPRKYLALSLVMDTPPLPGNPWFGRVELTNTSTFPIYCGPYGALVPNILVSAMVYDPGTRDIGQRLLLSLQKQIVLKPGQTVSLYRPLDSGPLHNVLLDPNKKLQVIFTAMLDPVRMSDGSWAPGPMGLLTDPLTANRTANRPPRDDELLRQARTGSQSQKIDATRWVQCIVAGKKSRDTAQTQPALTPQTPLTETLVALLSDTDPLVKAHALAVPEQTTLIEPVFQAAMPSVNDPNWLVRLMAVRFFAHQQGDKFTRALKNLSRTDPDLLVRSLMAAYYADFTKDGNGP